MKHEIELDDSVIDRRTPEYAECIAALKAAAESSDRIVDNVRPPLLGERYFTTLEMMTHFHISRRALQNYRDNGILPFTSIGGIILFPETKIIEVLEKNYYKPSIFGR